MKKDEALKILDGLRERCLRDPQFKEQLRATPVEALAAAGVPRGEIDVNATQAPAGMGAQVVLPGEKTLIACTEITCCCIVTACSCPTLGNDATCITKSTYC
jgi:hypothetical protein